MTTKLTKPLSRVIGEYVVTLSLDGIAIREKGKRLTAGPIPVGAVYQRAIQADVERTRRTRTRHHGVSRGLLATERGA